VTLSPQFLDELRARTLLSGLIGNHAGPANAAYAPDAAMRPPAPVGPGAALKIEFRLGPRMLEWRVREGARDVASGQIGRADIRGATAP